MKSTLAAISAMITSAALAAGVWDSRLYSGLPSAADSTIDADVFASYHLEDPGGDFDGDGLSNYAEYLASEVLGIAVLDPELPRSNIVTPDRYRRFGELYVGEVLADHDRIDDAWEARFESGGFDGTVYAARGTYDPDLDLDGDGWSNFAEYMAGTDPSRGWPAGTNDVATAFPVPVVQIKTVYAGSPSAGALALVVKAWSERRAPDALGAPDAVWLVDAAEDAAKLRTHFALGRPTSGFLREGPATFVVECDAGAYGVVRHVDVGWAGAKFTVELTDYNPVTPRIDLVAGTADRVDGTPPVGGVQSNMLEAASTVDPAFPTRVRVVRYAINGYPVVKYWGNGMSDVVYDKTWNKPDRKFSELDFLLDDQFDIDWTDSFTAKVASPGGVTRGSDGTAGNIAQVVGSGTSITNIEYLVVIGDGPATWDRGTDTNTVVTARVDRIVRRFGYTNTSPAAEPLEGVLYSARPTFRWRMNGENGFVSRFGSSYTAFRLQVKNRQEEVVYDSGLQRAPKVNAAGNFEWTAPLCAGSMMSSGYTYDAVGVYSWRVSMYNAKFRSDAWSLPSVFETAVNAQQEVNDHGYSSIAVAVKYAGPANVLEKCADMTTTKGKVIVQAFSAPDFTGEALSAGMATNDVAELALPERNAWLKGLSAIGTYYVRAFIDMDGDGKLSDWEPWGYADDAVTLVNDGTMVKAPLVSIWIDDSDSDRDWIPDAYEYAAKGWETPWATLKGNNKNQPGGVVLVQDDGGICLPFALDKLTGAGISKGLPGASMTVMQSENFVSALLGLDTTNATTIAAINAVARQHVVPGSVCVAVAGFDQSAGRIEFAVGGNHGTEVSLDGQGSGTIDVVLSRRDGAGGEWSSQTNTVHVTHTNSTATAIFPESFTTTGVFKVEVRDAQSGN